MDPIATPTYPTHHQPLSRGWASNGAEKRAVDVLIDQLQAWGVRHVFGVAGDTTLPFISALGEREGIEFVATRHEEAAAFMAKAYAAVTGELGVCTATAGPGAAHLINGLADAKTDSQPVLAITGQAESFRVGTVYKQVINQQQLLSAVTQFTAELAHPEALIDVVGRAMRTAIAHSTVSHVSIPKDFWLAPVRSTQVRPPEPYLLTPARSLGYVIDGALHLLHQAARPLIAVGNGARGAIGEVFHLAERLRAPIIYSLPVAGRIPRDHHLVIGGLGEGGAEASLSLLTEADCVLRIGTTWWPKEYTPSQARTIDINLRPDHIGMGSPTAYGIVGEAQEIIPALLAHAPDVPRPEWEARAASLRSAWESRLHEETREGWESRSKRIHPALIVERLSARIPHDAIVTLDVGDHVLWFNRHFRGSGSQDVLVSGYWRSMGFGLPAALAAKKAHPSRPVVAVVGDGGLGMTLAELTTAVQHRLAVTVVVFNNRSLGMEENAMEKQAMPVYGVKLHNPSFARYAELCGAAGIHVDSPGDLDAGIERALWHAGQESRTAVVDIATSPVMVPAPEKLHALTV